MLPLFREYINYPNSRQVRLGRGEEDLDGPMPGPLAHRLARIHYVSSNQLQPALPQTSTTVTAISWFQSGRRASAFL